MTGDAGHDCVFPHAQPAAADEGHVCRRHLQWINDMLTQIAELYTLRGDVVLPGPGGGRHATPDGSPAPGRIEVMALSDPRNRDWHDDDDAVPDVPGTLYGYIRLIAEERNDQRLCDVPGDVPSLAGVLRRERHWIARQSWVDDYAADLHALHQVVARAVGVTMWPESIGPCPACQAKLFVTIGVDVVTCRHCRAEWTGVHLARLNLIHEKEGQKA